jgi:hypothetical protein
MELPNRNIGTPKKTNDDILQYARRTALTHKPTPTYMPSSASKRTSQRTLDARASFLSSLLYSVGLLALGGIVTGITYAIADDGGTYFVTTGLFVIGGIYFCVSIWHLLKWIVFAISD